ncbi:MAG: hypothetical protein HXY23_10995 [Parvularculaceae bacterium]|nr:hypothetical protein [Parvularculaceae bacterium]
MATFAAFGGIAMNRFVALAFAALVAACGPRNAEAPDPDSLAIAENDLEVLDDEDADDLDGEAGEAGAPVIAAAPPAPGASPSQGSRNLLRFEPAVIIDAAGFERPMGAASLFIPHGWKTEGGVFWARDFMCTNGYNFFWTATSPDGSMSLGVTPQAAWAYASGSAPPSPQPGCPVMQITSVRQYLEESVKRSMPNARVLDFRARPDLLAGAQPSRTPMPMGEIQKYSEAGEVLFAFADASGRDMRGAMAAVVEFQKMITDMSGMYASDPTIVQMPSAQQMRMEQVNAFAFPGFVATAPNGQLNLAFFEALRRTIKPNPQWQQRITGHNLKIGQVALEEGRKRAAMIARSNEEISRIRQETWERQQESSERRFREFGEALRGVETYADADAPGGTVELSHMYRHAWRLNDGSYVLTDDASFDPWRDLRMEGKQLEAVQ